MNEFDKIGSPDQVEIVDQTVAKKRKELIGTIRIHPGQQLYELNLATLEISVVKVREVCLMALDGEVKREYITKDNHWYEVAINRQNAERKFILRAKQIKESVQ